LAVPAAMEAGPALSAAAEKPAAAAAFSAAGAAAPLPVSGAAGSAKNVEISDTDSLQSSGFSKQRFASALTCVVDNEHALCRASLGHASLGSREDIESASSAGTTSLVAIASSAIGGSSRAVACAEPAATGVSSPSPDATSTAGLAVSPCSAWQQRYPALGLCSVSAQTLGLCVFSAWEGQRREVHKASETPEHP